MPAQCRPYPPLANKHPLLAACGRPATAAAIRSTAADWPLPAHNSRSGFDSPVRGFEDGLTGRSFLNVERPSLGRDGLFISPAERPGVSGDGVAARPAPKRYGRTDHTQIITW